MVASCWMNEGAGARGRGETGTWRGGWGRPPGRGPLEEGRNWVGVSLYLARNGQCPGSGDARFRFRGGGVGANAALARLEWHRGGSFEQCPGRLGLHRCRACPFLPALSYTQLLQLDYGPRTEPTERKDVFPAVARGESGDNVCPFTWEQNSSKGLQLSLIPRLGWCATQGVSVPREWWYVAGQREGRDGRNVQGRSLAREGSPGERILARTYSPRLSFLSSPIPNTSVSYKSRGPE